MKLLPIVPNCRAIVINSPNGNDGVNVKVFNEYQGIEFYCNRGRKVWYIDKSNPKEDRLEGKNLISEHQLMRIDGNEEKFKAEQEAEELCGTN